MTYSHLPVHRDQLWAQRSVTSTGELYLYNMAAATLKYWLENGIIAILSIEALCDRYGMFL